ncbi:MAG TPA: aminotransferase class I/II-fold pyridoxal phosphate-dependent enzyme [Xanthobacteraceae bacterium]|nr:aminotransferase class I/II-fold pyridoxal phosphate-dependent enzyme [Xanthobacteraceae bacterium]
MTAASAALQPTPPKAEGRSPFVRTHELLEGIKPGKPAINLSVGEPQHPIPPFVGPVLAAHLDEFGRYPANKGTDEFRRAVAGWLGRRYELPRALDPESEVIVLNGTREGLFLGAIAAKRFVARRAAKPAILIPNPFYAAYSAGAAAADCEPVYLPTTKDTGFLPDLAALDDELLGRTVAFYIASPSNPQGAIADLAYLNRLTALARRFGFLVFADECYCEIYLGGKAPHGMLEAAGSDFANVVVFHSLSKRSNLPGLRVGSAAGDKRFLTRYVELRNVAAPQVPVPAQRVAIAAYEDEAHVKKNRDLYVAKFDLADQIIGNRYGYKRPAGGFFLWLDVSAQGGDEAVTQKLWRDAGLRVIPGHYLARDGADGRNPGAGYIRVALVHDKETTAEALHRLVAVLG